MDNRSKIIQIKKQLLIIGLIDPGIAFSECSIESKIQAKTPEPINIEQTRKYKTALVPTEQGTKSCFVSFEVLYSDQWYPVYGEQEWDGTISATTACGMAKQHALKGFVHQHGEQVVSANQEMTCADGEETKYYKLKQVGSVMPISKLKGDPEHARPFMDRGASCWWVKDVEWDKDKLHSFNGIACQVEGEQHVLVDKF